MITYAVMHKPGRPNEIMLTSRIPTARFYSDGDLWQCARTAWLAGVGAEGHHVVLHDDVRPCVGFEKQLREIVCLFPDQPLCLWGSRVESVLPPPGGFYSYSTFCWGGALCLPRAWIADFISFCDEKIDPSWNMDDTRFTLWCAETGRQILVPVPNLIQHGAFESVARPGKPNQHSLLYEEEPCVEWRKDVVEVPGDPQALIVSRRKHYV